MVFVSISIGSRQNRRRHKGIHLGCRFLQMVTTVIITTCKGTCLRSIELSTHICFVVNLRTTTVFKMTWPVEPRFTTTTTVNAIELKSGILHHGIHLVAHNKGARNVVSHLDAQTSISRDTPRNITYLNYAGLACDINLITPLIIGSSIGTSDNGPR